VQLSYEEMRRLVGYLVSTQFFEERGNPEQGEKVFARKHCGGCHDDPASGAQGRSAMAGRITSFGMVAALWEARSSDAEPHAPEKDSLASVQRLGDGGPGSLPVRFQVETTAAIAVWGIAGQVDLPREVVHRGSILDLEDARPRLSVPAPR